MSNSDAFQDPSPTPAGKGCRPGCLILGFVVIVVSLVVGLGIGQPYTYWRRVGELQVFEGPDSVTVFIEVQVTQRPGLPRPSSDPFSFEPIDSGAYQMRIWCEGEAGDARGTVWAESWAKDAPWMVNLLTVNTKRWWSYKEPSWPHKESPRGRAHHGFAL